MKIIFILVGFSFTFLFILLPILITYVDNSIKLIIFYVIVAIIIGGLGDAYDWLESKILNNQHETKI